MIVISALSLPKRVMARQIKHKDERFIIGVKVKNFGTKNIRGEGRCGIMWKGGGSTGGHRHPLLAGLIFIPSPYKTTPAALTVTPMRWLWPPLLPSFSRTPLPPSFYLPSSSSFPDPLPLSDMDLHDWEFLDDGAFLDFPGDAPLPPAQFDMDYFTCPSPNSSKIFRPVPDFVPPGQPALIRIPLEKTNIVVPTVREDHGDLLVKKAADSQPEPPAVMAAETDQDSTIENKLADMKQDSLAEAGQDSVSQVFFAKPRENEFADMKLESPMPEAEEMLNSPRLRVGLKKSIELDFQGQKEVIWEEDNGALKIWKWSLNGIGAICSFGIAAATICVIVLGSHHGHKHPHHTTHKLRFQIYSDDKRNEAMSGVRGGPMSRAQITTGGRYEF